jgi:branched-chain amino acid transport system substrate-binding protein
VQTDHVVGIVGSTSLIECSVNSGYWQKLGFFVIDSGIAPECYSTPNSAAVNMGPRYSSDGAVQYALSQHVSKIVFDQSNVPGTGYIAAGPAALAKEANVPIVQLTERRRDRGQRTVTLMTGPGSRPGNMPGNRPGNRQSR